MKQIIWFPLLLILLFALSLTVVVSAQEIDTSMVTDDEVNAIAKHLYCPVCENIPLDVCGTTACAQWRELIREKLALGWSEDEIKEYFVLQYGDRVLSEPPPRGLNWLVYVVPPIVFFIGAYVLYRGIQSWRTPIEPERIETETSDEPLDEYVARLEEELKKSG